MASTVPATFASAIACPPTCTSLIDPAGISLMLATRSNAILPPKWFIRIMDDSVQLGNVYAISPGAFRFVKHFVRFAYQRVKIFEVTALAARNSKCRRNVYALSGEGKRQRAKQLAKPVDRQFDIHGA